MPKFVKGSQEAKDYMAGLRAKRMNGGKMPQPPRNKVDTGKVYPLIVSIEGNSDNTYYVINVYTFITIYIAVLFNPGFSLCLHQSCPHLEIVN